MSFNGRAVGCGRNFAESFTRDLLHGLGIVLGHRNHVGIKCKREMVAFGGVHETRKAFSSHHHIVI